MEDDERVVFFVFLKGKGTPIGILFFKPFFRSAERVTFLCLPEPFFRPGWAGYFSLFAQRKVTKRKGTRRSRPLRGFPALLAGFGARLTRSSGAAAKTATTPEQLKQEARLSPNPAAMLGGPYGSWVEA